MQCERNKACVSYHKMSFNPYMCFTRPETLWMSRTVHSALPGKERHVCKRLHGFVGLTFLLELPERRHPEPSSSPSMLHLGLRGSLEQYQSPLARMAANTGIKWILQSKMCIYNISGKKNQTIYLINKSIKVCTFLYCSVPWYIPRFRIRPLIWPEVFLQVYSSCLPTMENWVGFDESFWEMRFYFYHIYFVEQCLWILSNVTRI